MLLHSMYDYSMLDILASIPIWLYYIPFLLFAILLPCIWHLSFVHAGFSLCNALFHSSFYHYSYSVLPLFLLRHTIIASSMLTAIIHPDGASLVHRSQTLLWYNQCNGGYDNFQRRFYIGEEEEGWMVWKYEYFFLCVKCFQIKCSLSGDARNGDFSYITRTRQFPTISSNTSTQCGNLVKKCVLIILIIISITINPIT